MTIDDDLGFVQTNLPYLAGIADGQFIDPNVRPKEKRVTWSEKSYTKDVEAGLVWWKAQPEADKLRYLHSVKEYTIQAIRGEFPHERARWIYSILMARPDKKLEQADAEKKERMRRLRAEQHDMSPLDIMFRCLKCGKFAHERDETNNKRHEKSEVCTCGGVSGPQAEMKERISAYRAHLKERKQFKKEKERRVAQYT